MEQMNDDTTILTGSDLYKHMPGLVATQMLPVLSGLAQAGPPTKLRARVTFIIAAVYKAF